MKSSSDFLFIFDTNTLISGALIQKSIPSLCLQKAIQFGSLSFSRETLLELKEVLEREKFEKYLTLSQRLQFFEEIKKVTRLFNPEQKFDLCRDPRDNKFLDLAFSSNAAFLITGDQDLLILKRFHETEILSPSDFLKNFI